MEKELNECTICAGREKLIAELDKLEKNLGADHRERKRTPIFDTQNNCLMENGYTNKLNECPNCKKSNNNVICGSTVESFDFDKKDIPATSHTHNCPICKKVFGPFKGKYSDSELRSAKTLSKYGVAHVPQKWDAKQKYIKAE